VRDRHQYPLDRQYNVWYRVPERWAIRRIATMALVPRHADPSQRRAHIAEALWTIAERDGFAAATVRRVATEAGVSVGLVQHYSSTKDEMLLFALRWVGDDFSQRLIATVGALPEPRDPYEVVRTVLVQRLPQRPRDRVHAQALISWLSRAVDNPELA